MAESEVELNILDPLRDPRWNEFIHRHPRASIFHTAEWVEALSRTYRYRPLVLTSTPTGQPLRDGLICCAIDSWLTGKRLVSLPFSDHCQPLGEAGVPLREWLPRAQKPTDREGFRFLELRPREPLAEKDLRGFYMSGSHWIHRLSLEPSAQTLFSRFHPSCIQRKIRKADKENLSRQTGNGPEPLGCFYRLQVETRRRHGLPPQPRAWFQNLIDCLGDRLQIHLARSGDTPVAAVLTLRFKKILFYKYGCSDPRWHPTGVVPWLLWQAILDGIETGCQEFDMGRTETTNQGLAVFKDRWNAQRAPLNYYRHPEPRPGAGQSRLLELSKPLWNHLPDRLMEIAGGLLYRHFG